VFVCFEKRLKCPVFDVVGGRIEFIGCSGFNEKNALEKTLCATFYLVRY